MLLTTDPGYASPFALFSMTVPATGSKHDFEVLSARLIPRFAAREEDSATVILWTRAKQQNSAFTRKRGFWNLFPDTRARVGPNEALASTPTVSGDGVRFLATAQLPITELGNALFATAQHTRNAGIVLVGRAPSSLALNEAMPEILQNANFELALVGALLKFCETNHVITLIPTGRFDDPDIGLFVCCPADWGDTPDGLIAEAPPS